MAVAVNLDVGIDKVIEVDGDTEMETEITHLAVPRRWV